MYENDGTPILAVVLGPKKNRVGVVNDRGKEIELEAARFHIIPGNAPSSLTTVSDKKSYLETIRAAAITSSAEIPLREVWSAVVSEGEREYSTSDLTNLYFGDDNPSHHLAMRFALLHDSLFFKRKREAFLPRGESVVEELEKASLAKEEKLKVLDRTCGFFAARLNSSEVVCPAEAEPIIALLTEVAANAPHLSPAHHKEAKEFLDAISAKVPADLSGSPDQRAFMLLLKGGILKEDSNLSLIRNRPHLSFHPESLTEASALTPPSPLTEDEKRYRVDLTHLRVVTIDDASTLDMDDGLSIERTRDGFRIGVHISDVASSILPHTALDREAMRRATSIYLPEDTIPMFPHEISEDKLSLRAGELRRSMSCLFEVSHDLKIIKTTVTPSLVQSAHKLTYIEVDQILEHGAPSDRIPELEIIYNFALDRETERLSGGGLRIQKRDVEVSLDEQGNFTLVEVDEQSPARSLIAELAVQANKAFAEFAQSNGFPLIFRGQPQPEGGDEEHLRSLPQGPALDFALRMRLKRSSTDTRPVRHATLGLAAYTQVTSPIRRYLDLINQRQLLSFCATGHAKYNEEELRAFIHEVEEPLSIAVTVSRETKRYWLLKYLKRKASRGEQIKGTIIRSDHKICLAELNEVYLSAPVKLRSKLGLGAEVTLRIANVDPRSDQLRLEEV